ncbi:MAG: spermidine/putrescine ABC transporter substrate-binding protein [Ruminococcaceae bacterium]|nr:spermidine/putrescine ABC transporter substrate-binding protein [Oscillospiraceae bacterium]
MKKNLKYTLLTVFVLLAVLVSAIPLSSCSSAEKLYLFNYGDYIDPDVYELFEEEYGIRVVVDEYAAPEDMYAKFTSGTASYDLICSSDYMIEKLIAGGYLSEIDYENIPNFSNIDENQKNAQKSFDAELKYTVPHFWGTVGLLYNTETVDAEDVKSWDVLFSGEYSGRIIMPNSERDAMFTALKKLGYDANTKEKSELDAAAALLKEQKKDVQAYLLDEAARVKLESGNADIAVIYNGEAYLAFENNDKLDFVIPDEGTCIWQDAFAVPKDTKNKANAELFLNFLCREDIAKMNFEYIYYSTPNKAVTASLDAEILAETAIFPDVAVYHDAEVFKYLGKEIEEYYAELWKAIKSS